MTPVYAVCQQCEAMICPPTAYAARCDEAAMVHARTTGHSVNVCADDDPDEPRYTVPGEPALFAVGPGERQQDPRAR